MHGDGKTKSRQSAADDAARKVEKLSKEEEEGI